MSTIERTWMFAVPDRAPVTRNAFSHLNPLVTIVRWMNYLGTRRIDDGYPRSRPTLPPNFRVGGGPGF